MCGHGYFDMSAYESYFAGSMVDYSLPDDEIARAMEQVPAV
jgi:tryptophan synthase beta chain